MSLPRLLRTDATRSEVLLARVAASQKRKAEQDRARRAALTEILELTPNGYRAQGRGHERHRCLEIILNAKVPPALRPALETVAAKIRGGR